MLKLRKIISGGQTGADRAGLEIAKELGLETGGWVPRAFRTERGSDASLREFKLSETGETDYSTRTRLNVLAADATVVFGHISQGSQLTVNLAAACGRPVLVNPHPQLLREWLERFGVVTLNVAGNRASKNPGIARVVKNTIREALKS